MSEHSRERGFPDAAFPAEDEYLVFDTGETGGDERDVRVGALGGGGAY